jgi:adenylosuccinate lyase
MAEVLHANIFFFITGIGVIVLTVLVSIALYHFIKILTSVRRIVERVEAGTETLIEDIEDLRTYVMEESFLARFFHAVVGKKRAHTRTHESEDTGEEEVPRKQKRERRNKTSLTISNED